MAPLNQSSKYVIARLSPDGVISAALLNRDAQHRGEPEYTPIFTSPKRLPEELKKIGTASEIVLADMILYDTRQFAIATEIRRIVEDSSNTTDTIDAIQYMRDKKTRFTIFSPYLHAREVARVTGMNGNFDRTKSSAESIHATVSFPSAPIYPAIASVAQGLYTPLAKNLMRPGEPTRHTMLIGARNISAAFFCGGMDVKRELYGAAKYNLEDPIGVKIQEAAYSGAAMRDTYTANLQVLGMRNLEHILSVDVNNIDPKHVVGMVMGATPQNLKVKEQDPNKVIVFQHPYNGNPNVTAFFVRSYNPLIDAALLTANAVSEFGGIGGGSMACGSGLVLTREMMGVKKSMNEQIATNPTIAEYKFLSAPEHTLTQHLKIPKNKNEKKT